MAFKKLRNVEHYSVGLDLGTGSVGWCACDSVTGELLTFNSRPTWGSRLFPSAETAAETRIKRNTRRRLRRRRRRIDLLQRFFAEEMSEKDPEFFIRLNQSYLLPEDRNESTSDYRWPLFNDSDFNEANYYKSYPTIYHLRKHLMETDSREDIRLVYLALHNIVKCRGNFLKEDIPNLSAKNVTIDSAVEGLIDDLKAFAETDPRDLIIDIDAEEFKKACNPSSGKTALKDDLGEACGKTTTAIKNAVVASVMGNKVQWHSLFGMEEKVSFAFSEEDKVEEFKTNCTDEQMIIFDSLMSMYSTFILLGVLGNANGQTLSYAKVEDYNSYALQLKALKDLVRKYAPEEYFAFFRGSQYEGTLIYDKKKAKGYTKYNDCRGDIDAFYKEVAKLFENIPEAQADPEYQKILSAMGTYTFLKRQKSSDNGAIPFQLHLEEMEAIVDNQGKYYSFLLENKDKLLSLVSTRVPYYVGPIKEANAPLNSKGETRFAWSERREGTEGQEIFPWNWEDIIDKDKSAQDFIERMTGTCTYLRGEKVLPRCSLTYELFCVLNELNGARMTEDGDKYYRFDYLDRMNIVEHLFKKRKSVSYKAVEKWFEKNSDSCAKRRVKGGQGETGFESKLSSWNDFCEILDIEEIEGSTYEMVEEIILWCTLFEDRKVLRARIEKYYGDVLSDKQIAKIINKSTRYVGWGRLSETLLVKLTVPTEDGPMSIMDILLDGNPAIDSLNAPMNFMEIISDDHLNFSEAIENWNIENADEERLAIEDIPGSPALKRTTNQVVRIVEEISSIAGHAPDDIFIEFAREEEAENKGKRTKKRFDAIGEGLKNLKKVDKDLYDSIYSSFKSSKDGGVECDDALYLYMVQCGKCMYSGDPLDINRLSDYQIDHIIPQAYVKDDSLENRVLVKSEFNQRKSDNMLIDPGIQGHMRDVWNALHDAKLIGDKKFFNLTRTYIPEKKMLGFINRQLVETRQITKHVANILEQDYPDTRIVPIKAGVTSELRHKCKLIKCREVNNYHHAHDAYLACQIGRFVEYRHPAILDNPIGMMAVVKKYVQQQAEEVNKYRKMPGSAGFIVQSFLRPGFDAETGEFFHDAWNADAEIANLRATLDIPDCHISRMPEIQNGAFWDETIYSPRGGRTNIPIKNDRELSQYGGYSREQFAYFFMYVVLKGKKKKKELRFKGVPRAIASALEADPSALEKYAERLCNENNEEFQRILVSRVYRNQKIVLGEDVFYIRGESEVRNAIEPSFSNEWISKWNDIKSGAGFPEIFVSQMLNVLLEKYENLAPGLARKLHLEDYMQPFMHTQDSDQKQIIFELLGLINGNRNTVDLSSVGGSKYAGQLHLSYAKEASSCKRFSLIDSSVTGMYEKRRKIEI